MALGDELSSLNFEAMIGGPLSAIIKAQTQAAMTSVDFIKAVGFNITEDTASTTSPKAKKMDPVMVSFKYKKPVEKKVKETVDGKEVEKVVVEPVEYELSVPLLTMLPIPFIRVEEATVDFNAKITGVTESSSTSEMGIGVELKAKAGWGWGSASLKANFSYKSSTASSEKIERTYSMAIHVRAVQDELPAGTERLLGILENSIKEAKVETKKSE